MRARRNACELEQRAVRFRHLLLALEAEHAHVIQALPPFFFSMYIYPGQAYGGIGGCYTCGGTEGVCGAARVWHACSATGSGTAACSLDSLYLLVHSRNQKFGGFRVWWRGGVLTLMLIKA